MTQSFFFLLINASIVWGVIAGCLMWFGRSKLLVLAILLAPYVIGSNFRHIPGMPELIGFYGVSMLYGAVGIVLGIFYADYQRAKQYLARVSKSSFIARGGIALSSLYLISYFGQKILLNNPIVEFALGFIQGGDRAREIVSKVDYDGAITAGVGIIAGFAVLTFNKYREHRQTQNEATIPSKALDVS